MLFPHKAKEHRRSRLMHLPAEIRTMILRLLLVHDGPLRARNLYGEKSHPKVPKYARRLMRCVRERNEEVACSYDLAPGILATCQQLLNEGSPLLYTCNILGLQICRGEWDPDNEYYACGCGTFGCNGGLFVYAVPYVCLKSPDLLGRSASPMMELIKKFNTIQIDLNSPEEPYEPEFVRAFLATLSERLRDKIVHVKFIYPFHITNMEEKVDQLPDLMMLRCKDFKILDTDIPASNISTIADVVTSNRPVLNLRKMFDNFYKYCKAICSYCSHPDGFSPTHCHYVEWCDLENTVYSNNAVQFYKLRSELMKEIDVERERIESLRRQVFEDDVELDKDGLPAYR